MNRATPPLQCIQAFLTAARTASFRAAADELALSPSAFSRRIRSLETFLGKALYDRTGAVPRLTQDGMQYRRDLEPAMQAIEAATRSVRLTHKARRLRLMCPPSFAINWVMPNLRDYNDNEGAQLVDLVISRDLGQGLC